MSCTNVQPQVTVITPVYNRASYLDETILSVLNQDYENLQYVVLDDGSTDGSLQVIKKYADKLTWDSHPNMGETRTVNKGFSMASGEIVGVVNSDDPLLPNAISTVVKYMVEHPEVIVVYPDWNMIGLKGEVIEHIKTFDFDYINMLRWHHCMPGPGAFFRKEVVDKLNGRDPQFKYVGDFDFWLRAGLLGPFMRIPETLASFRVHPDSASISHKGDLMAREHVTLVKKIYSNPSLSPEVVKIKNEAFSSAYYIGGVVCGSQQDNLKRSYFLKALMYCPVKYLNEYKNRVPVILAPFSGGIKFVGRKVKAQLSSVKKMLNRSRRM